LRSAAGRLSHDTLLRNEKSNGNKEERKGATEHGDDDNLARFERSVSKKFWEKNKSFFASRWEV